MEPRRDASLRSSLGMINIIFTALGRIGSCPFRVMFVARLSIEDNNLDSKRARMDIQLALSFLGGDKIGTIQPINILANFFVYIYINLLWTETN